MSSFKQIKHLSPKERLDFFESFDLVFCDCDGVVWYPLQDFIPGSGKALATLERFGKKITFVTNNSIISVKDHIEKFTKQGQLLVQEDQIVHPAQTICDYLKSIKFTGIIYCLATNSFRKVLTDAGFQLTEEQGTDMIKSLKDLNDAVYGGDPVQAVVIDVDFNLSAAKLMRAHIQLQNPKCLYLAGAADAFIPFGKGEVIGPGAFIDVLSQAVGRQPITLGKPGKELRNVLLERYPDIPASRILFVGDSLTSDIAFARASGYQTLLVLTGGTKLKDVESLPPGHPHMPDYLTDCLRDLTDIQK